MGARELHEACPRCEVCDAPMAIAATGRPRRYCSNRCKQKAVRNRQILIGVMIELDAIRRTIDPIDWTDEDHRVT